MNGRLIDTYLEMLRNLSQDHKLDLISKLSESLKTQRNGSSTEKALNDLYGAFKSEEQADEIIAALRDSRRFTRGIEEL